MRERETLLAIAPHLVFPLAFLLPEYHPSLWYRFKLRVGMFLYDVLSLDKSLPRRKWLGRDETLAAEPRLRADGLAGAWRFYDAQVPFVERLVIENLIDAEEHGALVLNHARAIEYLREGYRVTGARVRDALAGTDIAIRADVTVNATGPWLDETIAPLRNDAKPLLRLTKGIHLVTPRGTQRAHVLFAKSDGRLLFVVPFFDTSIIGTTDTDYAGDPADAAATDEDVRYLQEAAHQAFPDAPFDRIHFTWAGVRALVREEGVSEGEVSRKHALYDHERRGGIAGLLSVLGGKITAYRDIAEEVVDLVLDKRGDQLAKCTTASAPLPGARDLRPDAADDAASDHLRNLYGSRASRVRAIATGDPSLARPLCPHHHGIAAEVVHAVRVEWARTIGDVLLRRTMLGIAACQGLDCVDAIATRMGSLLGWSAEQRHDELERYRRELEPMRRFSTA